MIPNHEQFLTAIKDHKKVNVRFYSKPDSGLLDRVCVPMDYGAGENPDGLNRYWLWDDASESSDHKLGLVSQQIVEMSILGEVFDPAQFVVPPVTAPVAVAAGLPPTSVAESEVIQPPVL
jgi:hypothetical protein